MHHKPALVFFCLLILVASRVSAQRTIVVDGRGGLGSHFKELPKAIAAARDGDIVLVREGFYAWPTTMVSSGITVQGTKPGVHGPYISGFLRLDQLPAGKTFALKDVNVTRPSFITNCQGQVLIDGVSSYGPRVVSSRAVRIRNCKLYGILVFDGSFVQFEGGIINGIVARTSWVEIADSTVAGIQSCSGGHGCIPLRAIHAFASEIRVRGRLAVLSTAVSGSNWAPVLEGDATSRLTLDSAVTLIQPAPGKPKIRGFGNGVIQRALPTMRDSGIPIGGQLWSYTLQSQPNDPFAIALGLPAVPVHFLGQLLQLDLRTLNVLHVGQQPASGVSTFTFRHSTLPNLRGVVFAFQGIAGTAPQLTNAISVSVR